MSKVKTLSEKIYKVKTLPDYENKDVVVQEIEALENFTDEERSRVFDNSSIVWILKNYTISELKKKAEKSLQKPDIHVGDVVKYGTFNDIKGVVLNVAGDYNDRAIVIYRADSHIYIQEGVSCYDLVKVDSVNVDDLLSKI